jgi:stage V sporulation protein B
MDKALEMGKSSATGSFHLLLGVAGSTIIMAIGTLVLNGMLPAEGVGLYGMALVPSSMINFFRDWGVNSALTKQIAGLRVERKEKEIHDVIVSGVVFELISGAILSVVCFALAWPLAVIISPQGLSPQDISNLSTYISIMSLSVFAGAIASAATGIFVGYERMKLSSFTQILQAIVKTALGPLLIILGFGVLGAIYAAMTSIVAGGIISLLIVYLVLFRPLQKSTTGRCDIKTTLRPMLKYGLPLTASTIVIGVLPLVFTLTMSTFAGKGDQAAGNPFGWMIGNYFAAANFAVLLTFVSIPIATALFPIFSKLKTESELKLTQTVFISSVKYTALLLVPATLLLITLATPLVNTLFPKEGILQSFFIIGAASKFPYAPLFLSLSVTVNLFVLIGNVSLGTFQTGIGQTRQVMKQSLVSLVLGLPLAYGSVALFYSLGGNNGETAAAFAVIGGIIGSLVASLPGMLWAIIWSWKNYRVRADFGVSGKILFSSIVASLVTYLVIGFLSLPYFMILIVGLVVFLIVYLSTLPLSGAVNRTDIDNFRSIFSGLGIVSKLLNLPLLLMRKLCKQSIEQNLIPNENKSTN